MLGIMLLSIALMMHLDTQSLLSAINITEVDFLAVLFCYRIFLGLSDTYMRQH